MKELHDIQFDQASGTVEFHHSEGLIRVQESEISSIELNSFKKMRSFLIDLAHRLDIYTALVCGLLAIPCMVYKQTPGLILHVFLLLIIFLLIRFTSWLLTKIIDSDHTVLKVKMDYGQKFNFSIEKDNCNLNEKIQNYLYSNHKPQIAKFIDVQFNKNLVDDGLKLAPILICSISCYFIFQIVYNAINFAIHDFLVYSIVCLAISALPEFFGILHSYFKSKKIRFYKSKILVSRQLKSGMNGLFLPLSISVENDDNQITLKWITQTKPFEFESVRFTPRKIIYDNRFFLKNYFEDILNENYSKVSDENLLLDLITSEASIFNTLNTDIKGNPDFIFKAIQKNGLILEYLSEGYKDDEAIVTMAVSNNGMSLWFASERLKDNFDFCLKAVRKSPHLLQFVSIRLKSDKVFVLESISRDFNTIKYALSFNFCCNLKEENDFNLLSLSLCDGQYSENPIIEIDFFREYWSWHLVDESFIHYAVQANRNFIATMQSLTSLNRWTTEISRGSFKKLKKIATSRELALDAVRGNGLALEYVLEKYRNDREIVSNAVSSEAGALKFASSKLKKDWEIVYAAVSTNGMTLEFADQTLKNNKELALIAVNENGLALQFTSADLSNDQEIVVAAISNNPDSIEFASIELKADPVIMLMEISSRDNFETLDALIDVDVFGPLDSDDDQENDTTDLMNEGRYIDYLEDLDEDRDEILELIKTDSRWYYYLPMEFCQDNEITMCALTNDSWQLPFVPFSLKLNKDIAMHVVEQNPTNLKDLPYCQRNDKEIVFEALRSDGELLKYASYELKNDLEIVRRAISQNPKAIRFAGYSIQMKLRESSSQ